MKELTQAINRFGGNASALARFLGVTPDRVRVWKARGRAPEPWPSILRKAKPKKFNDQVDK